MDRIVLKGKISEVIEILKTLELLYIIEDDKFDYE